MLFSESTHKISQAIGSPSCCQLNLVRIVESPIIVALDTIKSVGL